MLKVLTIPSVLLFSFLSFAQTPPLDSLKEVVSSRSGNDTIGILAKTEWAYELRRSSPDSLKLLSEEALHVAQEVGFVKGQSRAHYGIGVYHSIKGDQETALEQLAEAEVLALMDGDKLGLGKIYNSIGIAYAYIGDYQKSIEGLEKAAEVYLELEDEVELAKAYNNIGLVYYNQGDYDQTLDYFFKSLEIREKGQDKIGLSITLSTIGSVYKDQGNHDQALEFYERALSEAEAAKDDYYIAFHAVSIGRLHLIDQAYDQALEFLNKALAIGLTTDNAELKGLALISIGSVYARQGEPRRGVDMIEQGIAYSDRIGDRYFIADAYTNLGSCYQQLGNKTEAIKYGHKSVELSRNLDITRYHGALEQLHHTYKTFGQYQMAYQTLLEFKVIQDSITNDKNTRKIAALEAGYAFQQERDSLAFAQEKERVTFHADINRRKTFQSITFIGLIVAAIIILTLFWLLRKLRLLNTEISVQKDNLEKLNSTKNRFFSIISHDLRGPISILTGYGDQVNSHLEDHYNTKNDPDLAKISNQLQRASDKVLTLLDSLLNWAMKEEGTIPYHPAQLFLNDCIAENNEILGPQAKAKSISLEMNLEQETRAWLDKNTFMTILRNLTGNALKFTPEGGKVSLATKKLGDKIQVSVIDNGIGISQEKIEKLFDINEKKVSTGTKGEKGMGLGLNLVHDFVKLNKGDMMVESEVGVGTTFKMVFPVSAELG